MQTQNRILGVVVLIIIVAIVAWFALKKPSVDQAPVVPPVEETTPVTPPVVTPPPAPAPIVINDGSYSAETGSVVNWEGTKPKILGYKDDGTIGIKSGDFSISAGTMTGKIVLDMKTLKTISTGTAKGESAQEKHMKSADFFDVTKYPTAVFTLSGLTKVEGGAPGDYSAKGDLKIKDKTNPVEFPVTVAQTEGGYTLTIDAKLDRTLWGIKYGSSSFFDDLKDGVIDNMFSVTGTIKFNSKDASTTTTTTTTQ